MSICIRRETPSTNSIHQFSYLENQVFIRKGWLPVVAAILVFCIVYPSSEVFYIDNIFRVFTRSSLTGLFFLIAFEKGT